MTTTEGWLQSSQWAHLAFSLAFDGIDRVITTTSDITGIATAYASTDWTQVSTGLQIVGEVAQEIAVFQPRIQPSSMDFTVVDIDGSLRRMLMGNPVNTASTFLSENMHASTTTAVVGPGTTAAFPAAGTAYIGQEAFTYSSISSGLDQDTFSITTRGKWSLFGTDSGTRIGRRHDVQPAGPAGPVISPEVRTTPRTHYNRMVGLVAHHAEQNASGATVWSTATLPLSAADAQLMFAGRIKAWRDNGDGSLTFTCVSAAEMLRGHIMSEQFIAELHDGMECVDKQAGVSLRAYAGATWVDADTTLDGSGTFTTGQYRYDELVSLIQGRLTAWQTAGTIPSTQKWTCELRQVEGQGLRVVVEMEASSTPTGTPSFRFGVGTEVARILGMASPNRFEPGIPTTSGRFVRFVRLERVTSTLYRFVAPYSPLVTGDARFWDPGERIYVRNTLGTWAPQPSLPSGVDADTEGFVQVGERIFAVTYSETSQSFLVKYTFQAPDENIIDPKVGVPIEGYSGPPQVKQVWLEAGEAGDLLLKVMLSTGVGAYNHATYDVHEGGFGLAIPADLIDIDSFRSLDAPYELWLDQPTPLADLIDEILQTYNRHLIWDEKLILTVPGFDAPNAEDIYDLTESTKVDVRERSLIEYGAEGIINRLVLQYQTRESKKTIAGYAAEITNRDRPTHTISVDDVASATDFGHRRTLEIKARGIVEPEIWGKYTAAPALAYFSRPFGIITRSINFRAAHLTPGDIVKITDDYLVDPETGERGVSGLAAWVMGTSFNWKDGRGFLTLVFLPTHAASRYARWSPAAKLDETHSAGDFDAGYDAVTPRLKVKSHEFSRATDDKDISGFQIGDAIQVREISPTPTSSPVVLTGAVTSVDSGGDIIHLTSTLSGGAFDAALEYVVEAAPWASASTEQRAFAFIGDDATHLIDGTSTTKLWAGTSKSLLGFDTTVDYATEYVRPGDDEGADGQPLSASKGFLLVKSLNNLVGYKTRNCLINEAACFAARAFTGSTYRLVYGPIWIPLFGFSRVSSERRGLVGKLRGNVSASTGWYRIAVTAALPYGPSDTAVNFPWATVFTEVSTTNTAYEWIDFSLTPIASPLMGDQLGCYFTVEMKNTNPASTTRLHGANLAEAAL